ncbi:hypothetical protein A5681_07875 [Mycobacterium scrofulaceum]|nr:hypothetical protein A5681_07875 [Mycobacterium scrofulaceum]
MNADTFEVGKSLLAGLRYGIGDQHSAQIAFTGVEQRGTRAIRQIATRDDDGVTALLPEPLLQARAIETAPPRFEDDHLAAPDML